MVIPGANLPQPPCQLPLIRGRFPREFPFDRADEPFDPSVLPGTARFDALVPDAEQPEPEQKHARDKHRLVICADELWPAIACHHLREFLPQRPRRFVREPLQAQAGTAGMIDDRQGEMRVSRSIGLGQKVTVPDPIARAWSRDPMLQRSPRMEDQILVPATYVLLTVICRRAAQRRLK